MSCMNFRTAEPLIGVNLDIDKKKNTEKQNNAAFMRFASCCDSDDFYSACGSERGYTGRDLDCARAVLWRAGR